MGEIIEYGWEARAREMRRRQSRQVEFWVATIYAAMATVSLALLVLLVWSVESRSRSERAAYLEGRFGLDHATAMVYAADASDATSASIPAEVR